MYRGAIRSILSELVRQGRLQVINDISIDQPKTKLLINKLKKYEISDKITSLIITQNIDQNLYLASRNLSRVATCEAKKINPVNLIKYEKILVTKEAIENINGALL